jgi:pimeloyl-ACP methyl ester carboxylesterase
MTRHSMVVGWIVAFTGGFMTGDGTPRRHARVQPIMDPTMTALVHGSSDGQSVVGPTEETFRIPLESGSNLHLFLRHERAAGDRASGKRAPVLFIHGASFPSGLAAAFRFDGVSWMDDLASRGFDVWALDFLGYGGSDRYIEMRDPPSAHPPLGRAPAAAKQIGSAIAFIAEQTHRSRVSIVAHSWGTIAAGLYAGEHADRVARLVQFGPVTRRDQRPDTSAAPAYAVVSEADQRTRFTGYVPRGEPPVLEPRHLAVWGPAYMATDSTSGHRAPRSVAVPNGPSADADAAWAGHLPYDPSKITAPVLIVRGEWDTITRDADARWLFDALTHAQLKRDVKISRATHVMHLEASRYQLYREVAAFLAGDDQPPAPSPNARTEAGR